MKNRCFSKYSQIKWNIILNKRTKKSFILQEDQRDCGVACLSSIINYYGGSIKNENLRLWSGTSRQGTTLLGLYQAAQKAGMEAEGCEADMQTLISHGEPVILHVVMPSHLHHYLVYFGDKKGKAIMGDPAKGIVAMNYDELESIWQSRTCLTLRPSERFRLSKQDRKEKKQWFWQLMKEDVQVVFAATMIGLLTAVLGLSLAVFNQKLIDDMIPDGEARKMTAAVVLLCFLLFFKGGLNAIRSIVLLRQGRLFNVKIATRFFSKLLELPKTFYDSRRSGDLLARLNDTSRIQLFITRTMGNMTISAIVLLVSLLAIFAYDVHAGLITTTVIPAYVLILLYLNRAIISRQRKVMEHYAHSESFYLNTLQGVEVLKDFGCAGLFGNKNVEVYSRYQKQVLKLGNLTIRLRLVADVSGTLVLGSLVGYGVFRVLEGVLQTGELLAIITLVSSVIPAVTGLLLSLMDVQEARIAFDRMYEFVKLPSGNIEEGLIPKQILPLKIDRMSFRFPGRSLLLSNISLNVDQREIVAILGESGCGKSTLTHLIKGDYQTEEGFISYNGEALSEIALEKIRKKVSIVPQTITLYNESILFNITLSSKPEEELEQTTAWLEVMGLMDYFRQYPQELLTQVGEEGINLSGGQKQVVAIARALIHQPELLILDEATSAMDRDTEANILHLIQKLKKQMSVLFITHRVHVLAGLADRIYILEGKTIVDQGSPSELMLRENAYSDFWKQINLYA